MNTERQTMINQLKEMNFNEDQIILALNNCNTLDEAVLNIIDNDNSDEWTDDDSEHNGDEEHPDGIDLTFPFLTDTTDIDEMTDTNNMPHRLNANNQQIDLNPSEN